MPPIIINTMNNNLVENDKRQRVMTYSGGSYPLLNQNSGFSKSVTMTQGKPNKGFAQHIAKEELYEQTVHLEKKVRKLQLELAEKNAEMARTKMSLDKNEKTIEEKSKETRKKFNEKDIVENEEQCTLANRIQTQYNCLKNDYKKLEEENNSLKANLTITTLKENAIEAQIMAQELEKMKNLYKHAKKKKKKTKKTKEKRKEEMMKLLN